jgi:hypothetical protein
MGITRIGGGFNLDNAATRFEKFKQDAPKAVANNSLNWFLKGFRQGGKQTNDSSSGWAPRKPGSQRDSGRGILVDTGALRRSIQAIRISWKEIIIGTQRILYAERHNEGLKGMPKREFIGDSTEMNVSNKKLLASMIRGIFK